MLNIQEGGVLLGHILSPDSGFDQDNLEDADHWQDTSKGTSHRVPFSAYSSQVLATSVSL
jgi:hypothetical protein